VSAAVWARCVDVVGQIRLFGASRGAEGGKAGKNGKHLGKPLTLLSLLGYNTLLNICCMPVVALRRWRSASMRGGEKEKMGENAKRGGVGPTVVLAFYFSQGYEKCLCGHLQWISIFTLLTSDSLERR